MKKLTLVFAIASIAAMNACDNPTTNADKTGAATTESVAPAKDVPPTQTFDTTKLAKGAMYYQCSMHPEVITDKPGDCPKCGMKLVMKHKSD